MVHHRFISTTSPLVRIFLYKITLLTRQAQITHLHYNSRGCTNTRQHIKWNKHIYNNKTTKKKSFALYYWVIIFQMTQSDRGCNSEFVHIFFQFTKGRN